VEFGEGPRKDSILLMSGWDGHTDWYRNARRNPRVRVWMRGKEHEAVVEPVPDAEVAEMLKTLAQIAPAANRMWSRWAGFEMDGSDASYLIAAPHFPSLYLIPVRQSDNEESSMDADLEQRRRAVLDLLNRTRRDTSAILSRLDPLQVVHTDKRAWRVRDILGHLGAWNGEAARSLEAYIDGGEYICVGSRGEYDDYNGPAADERGTWTLEQVWAEYELSHDQLRKIVETMPAGKWDGEVVYPWNERGTLEQLIKRMMKHEKADHCDLITGVAAG
jgi:hypothetical protein